MFVCPLCKLLSMTMAVMPEAEEDIVREVEVDVVIMVADA